MFGINKDKTEFVAGMVSEINRGIFVAGGLCQGLVHLGKVVTVIGTVGTKICTNKRLKHQIEESATNIASAAFDEIEPLTKACSEAIDPEIEVLNSEEFKNDFKEMKRFLKPLFK